MKAAADNILFPALEQTFMAVVLVDERNRVLFFNEAAEKLWGYSRDEVLGRDMNILIPGPLKHVHGDYVHHHRDGGNSRVVGMNRELQLERKDGTQVWTSFSLSKIDVDGRIHYMAAARDVSKEVARREQNRLLLLAVNNTDRAVVVLDEQRRIVQTNRAFTSMFGYGADEAMNQVFPDFLLSSGNSDDALKRVEEHLRGSRWFQEELLTATRNGREVWSRVSVNPVLNERDHRQTRNLVVTFVDITEERNIRNLERDVLAALTSRMTFQETGDYICQRIGNIAPGVLVSVCRIVDNRMRPWAAPGFPKEYGEYWDGVAVGEGVASCGTCAARGEPVMVQDISTDPLWAPYKHQMLPHGFRACWTYPVKRRDGSVAGTFAFYFRTQNEPDTFLVRIADASVHLCALAIEREEGRQQIDRLVRFDALTGLPNRQYLYHHLDKLLSGNEPELAVFFLDINRFRKVNESLGYSAGDQVIITLANRLQERFGPHHFISRVGGAQFVVVASACRVDEASHLAELMQHIVGAEMSAAGQTFELKACIGISHSIGGDRETLLAHAESAMERVRESGGSYQFFNPELNQVVMQRLKLGMALRNAITEGHLRLEYQPQIRAADGQVYGFEALTRWHDPHAGDISPGTFIPLAEETGEIEHIGLWALREVCRQLFEWREKGTNVSAVSVNLSAHNFRKPDLPRYIADLLNEYQLPGNILTIEITESAMMELTDEMLARVREIRAMGAGVSMDDFGTGFSSLASLAYLPVTEVKIDKSFIDRFARDRRVNALVEAVVSIGHNLDLTVVAEGVENPHQHQQLRKMGCSVLQGFLFSRPLSANTLPVWLEAYRSPLQDAQS